MTDRIDELEFEIKWSGRDEFSKLRLPALKQQLPKEFEEVAAKLTDPKEQAAALRWVLRGHSVEWAIGKVDYARKVVVRRRDKLRGKKEIKEIIG